MPSRPFAVWTLVVVIMGVPGWSHAERLRYEITPVAVSGDTIGGVTIEFFNFDVSMNDAGDVLFTGTWRDETGAFLSGQFNGYGCSHVKVIFVAVETIKVGLIQTG